MSYRDTPYPSGSLLLDPRYFLALGLGSGLSRWAPGTCGTIAAAPLFLYFLALLSSLFVMPIDNALSTLGKQGQSKAGALLVDAKIYEWNVHEVIRAVCCILAWTLVCIGIHEENQNGRRFMAHCKYLNNQIQQQKLRLDKVSGKQLQHATPEELDDLLAVQKSAQEATERAISYYRTRVR